MHRILCVVLTVLGLLAPLPLAAAGEDDELTGLLRQSDDAYNAGRYLDAVPVADRIVALTRDRYGEADPRYAAALNGLATFLQFTGSLDRAEQLLRQSLAIDLAALGPDHPDTVAREANLALVLLDEDKALEAAELLHRALVGLDRHGATAEQSGPTLSNFAAALERLNRLPEAERLYLAAIAAFKQHPAENAARLATSLGNLGILYKTEHRLDEARPLLEQAVQLLEGLSTPEKPHPQLATALNNLGTLREDKGDLAGAVALYRRALELDRTMLGPDNPRLATRLSNLAGLFTTRGRYDEAATMLREAMHIDRAAFGENHPRVANLLLVGARLLSAKKQWDGAYALIGQAAAIMEAADARRGLQHGRIEAGRDIADISLSQIVYNTFLQISGEWPWSDTSQFAKLGGPAFDVAQRLVTPAAAAAILRLASRYAPGDPKLAEKIREQQSLAEAWNAAEARIIAQLGRPGDRIDRAAVAADRRRQAQLEQQLTMLGTDIEQNWRNYAGLAGTKVLTIARVQELLRDDEALVYFADDGVHIHAFFITGEHAAWMPLAYTSATINQHVEALRCGLDVSAWFDDRADRCFKLLHINYSYGDLERSEDLPFDIDRAYQLHQALFGTLGSRVAGKRLILVPTGSLATLPFHVLVTEKPDPLLAGDERYRKAAWLLRQRPIAVLPSVASLEALRSVVPRGRATKPFLGIGDPLLNGPEFPGMAPDARRQIEALAIRAREKTACPQEAPPLPRIAATAASIRATRGVPAIAKLVRDLAPLPETADELCAIAGELGVDRRDVLLGARATKDAVFGLNRSGVLDTFAVIHFATHGLVSGEVEGLAEPALALTPVDAASDNGLLTASDIAGLKLNADLVVLSSCNTAAGSADDKTALSGLARAFFLAGTRALMVSHWPVRTDGAVELTTRGYKEMKNDPSIGPAEALRRSMAALVDEGGAGARPAYWAPFVVVGDGG